MLQRPLVVLPVQIRRREPQVALDVVGIAAECRLQQLNALDGPARGDVAQSELMHQRKIVWSLAVQLFEGRNRRGVIAVEDLRRRGLEVLREADAMLR